MMMSRYKTEMDQIQNEISGFVDLLQKEKVKSYLEIGCRFGGSLWYVANSLPKGSLIVAVDAPIENADPARPHLEACVNDLKDAGYDAHLFLGNSRKPEIINEVKKLSPFDVIFIDADHTIAGVTADWNNYGTMSKIVAFHDIIWDRPTKRKPIQVSHLWREIKNGYRHQEFVADKSEKGIGVLWTQ